MDILRQHLGFLVLNAVGGIAVLGSYAWGFATRADQVSDLWGGVPIAWKPVYTTSMLLATAGYFFFTAFFLSRFDPSREAVIGSWGFGLVQGLYAAVLLASALWMPLTFVMLRQPSDALWLLIRIDLAIVGLASIALLIALLVADVDKSGWLYPAAIAGLVAFCFQTAILDGTVWPHYFR